MRTNIKHIQTIKNLRATTNFNDLIATVEVQRKEQVDKIFAKFGLDYNSFNIYWNKRPKIKCCDSNM